MSFHFALKILLHPKCVTCTAIGLPLLFVLQIFICFLSMKILKNMYTKLLLNFHFMFKDLFVNGGNIGA